VELRPDFIGHPEGLDRVGASVGDLVFAQVVEGGVGDLSRSLTGRLEAEVVLGRPREAMEPGDATLALVDEGICKLRVPPHQTRCRVGTLPNGGINHPRVKIGIPCVGGNANEHGGQQSGVDVARVDHKCLFGAIALSCGDGHHPHLLRLRARDRDLGIDRNAVARRQSLLYQPELSGVVHECSWHRSGIARHLSDTTGWRETQRIVTAVSGCGSALQPAAKSHRPGDRPPAAELDYFSM
jgi:hypothetical protein